MELEYRMYGLVPYNISPIQQGIQFGHAVQEYNNMFWGEFMHTKESNELIGMPFHAFQKWANNCKTFIILNGGTTNDRFQVKDATFPPTYKGSLNNHVESLKKNDIPYSTFHEPDLNNALTAIVFLVDERVFNTKKYPDFRGYVIEKIGTYSFKDEIKRYTKTHYEKSPDIKKVFVSEYIQWCNILGAPQNVFLREFLSQFKLA
jgi:hypothetical protein